MRSQVGSFHFQSFPQFAFAVDLALPVAVYELAELVDKREGALRRHQPQRRRNASRHHRSDGDRLLRVRIRHKKLERRDSGAVEAAAPHKLRRRRHQRHHFPRQRGRLLVAKQDHQPHRLLARRYQRLEVDPPSLLGREFRGFVVVHAQDDSHIARLQIAHRNRDLGELFEIPRAPFRLHGNARSTRALRGPEDEPAVLAGFGRAQRNAAPGEWPRLPIGENSLSGGHRRRRGGHGSAGGGAGRQQLAPGKSD